MCTQQKRKRRKFCRQFTIFALSMLFIVMTIYQYLIRDLDFIFSSPMTKDDLHSLNLTLGTLLSELNRLNVTYFMIGGTLLGSYRHHGRIPWDDDVDLMLNSSDKKRIYKALTALEPDYQLWLSHSFNSAYHWKFFPLRHGRSVPLKSYRWPFVDLLFFSENDTHVWNPSRSYPNEVWPRSVIFPLRQRPFDHFQIPAPCSVLRALIVDYSDTSICVSSNYSHKYDLRMPWWSVAVKCSDLAGRHPMVYRRSATNGFLQVNVEFLVLGNRILHTITLRNHV